ncbi:MAG: lipid-A-disaccharide synthase N-terminal domain-containing protein [Rikenellaceae bacterium]
MSSWSIFAIGFIAQLFFSARLLLQWVLSEKAHKVVSPAIFWQLSIIGSFLLFVYGWVRDDFAIIFGQLISYYVYIWNLNIQDNWKKINKIIRFVFVITTISAIIYILSNWDYNFTRLFENENIPLTLLIYGSLGQLIFTLRFVYQWIYSLRRGESILPQGFWIISLIGSLIIISYAIYRHDPVLILGQCTGAFVYTRNLFIIRKSKLIHEK